MKFFTEIMNRISRCLDFYCLQRTESIHEEVQKACANSHFKGVGFLKIEKGRVVSIDPENLVITVLKGDKK